MKSVGSHSLRSDTTRALCAQPAHSLGSPWSLVLEQSWLTWKHFNHAFCGKNKTIEPFH